MKCQIFRNDDGQITRVEAPNGKPSILYQSILDVVKDPEVAIEQWARVYTPSFKQRIGDWENGFKKSDFLVKPGVEELFESNPELANEVYEALGYDISNIDLKINRVGNRINVVTSSSNNKAQIDIDIEDKNAYITNTFVEKGQQGFGTLSYIKLANELIKQGLTLTSDLNGIDLQESGKALWESLVSKNLAFYNSNIGRYVFSGQQAQQLYSQYLDTIFPDSKVKDIVYHGTDKKFDVFDFTVNRKFGNLSEKDSGMFFSFDIDEAAGYGDGTYKSVIKVLVNSKNPVEIKDLIGNRAAKYKSTNDAVIGLEPDTSGKNIVVFEPEQIHILGNKQDIEGFKKFVDSNISNTVELDQNGEPTLTSTGLQNILGNFKSTNTFNQLSSKEVEDADVELNGMLMSTLKPFGVQFKTLDEYKERTQLDGLGVTDVLNKVIYLSQQAKIDTLPEEVAHMAIMLMGEKHPDMVYLMENIPYWSGYNEILEEYREKYDGNFKKINIEAIAKLISQSIVKKYRETGGDIKLIERAVKFFNSFLQRVKEIFMAKESPFNGNYSVYLADKIAVNLLSGNTNYIASLKNERPSVNFSKVIDDNPFAKNVIDTFTKRFSFKLTGSLAVAGQGETIYRPADEPIHDLDFTVNDGEAYNDAVNYLGNIGAIPIHNGWGNKNKDYVTYSFQLADRGLRMKETKREDGWLKEFELYDQNGNKVEATAKNTVTVDFFVYYKPNREFNIGEFTSWQDIFKGKFSLSPLGSKEMMMQRDKDQRDYILNNPLQREIVDNQFVYLQKDQQSDKAPDENINIKIRNFLSSIGVSVESVSKLIDQNGNKIEGVALADMLSKIIQVVEGRSDITTLPEEAAHFFVEMLGTGNPLYKEMYSKITGYNIYSEVVAAYKDNKLYRNSDGTINFDKLKKEAIGKVIMRYILSQETGEEKPAKVLEAQKWWQRAWNYIKERFGFANKRNGVIEDPFAKAASQILDGNTTGLNTNIQSDELYLQASNNNDPGYAIFNRIRKDQDRIVLDNSIDPVTKKAKHIYNVDNKPIVNSDGTGRSVNENVVKPWYKNKFPVDRRSDIEMLIDEMKAKYGDELHSTIQDIFKRYIDTNTGLPRTTPLPFTGSKFNIDVYTKLNNYIAALIRSYPNGTRFMTEVRTYNSKKRLPGTIDLIVILKSGKAAIYDWKSQEVRDDETELKWFKEPAYRMQLDEYAETLTSEYGILEFEKVRAIPIRTIFNKNKMGENWVPTDLKNIEIGPIDPSFLPDEKEYLLPVVSKTESTGNEMLDKLIVKLNDVYDKLSQKSTKDKEKKNLELNKLKKTIRTLQVKKNMKHFVESGLIEINKYYDKILDKSLTQGEALEGIEIVRVYAEGSAYLRNILIDLKKEIQNETDPLVKADLEKQQADYTKMALNAQDMVLRLQDEAMRIGDELSRKEGITGLLNRERVMDYLKRNMRSLSTLDTAAAQMLNRILNRARHERDIEIENRFEKLSELREKLIKWGSSKGISTKDIFNGILDGTNFLDIYSKEFFSERSKAIKRGDVDWIKANTVFDKEAYQKAFLKYKEAVESDIYSTDPEVDKEKKTNIILRWIELHNGEESKVAMMMNKGNFRKPIAKWYSDKYKELYRKDSSGQYVNKPLVDTYEYFQELLQDSVKANMIDYEFGFLPSIHKTKLEAFVFGDYTNLSKKENIFQNLAVDSSDSFGKIDPLSGKQVMEIPVYYTRDLGEDKSLDLFKVFGLWAAQTANYKAMSAIEDTANLLLFIESNKGSIQTNAFGNVKKGSELPTNTINADTLESHIKYQVYGQKVETQNDIAIEIGDKKISAVKGLQKAMHWFSLKTLALNPISGTAALVGGTLNASFMAAKKQFFSDSDWAQGIYEFSKKDKMAHAFLDYIAPELQDDLYNKTRQLSISDAVAKINTEKLFFIQRGSDQLVLYPVAIAMYQSHMVNDEGKIVSIRDYVKDKYNYENIYNLSSGERKEIMKKMEKEIDELKKTRSLKAKSKIVNDKLVIEGLERNSDEIMKFRNKIKKINKTLIGNSTREDINQIRMGILGQVFLQFRSWIPQMVTERFGDMAYDSELETYTYGKARIFFGHLYTKKIIPTLVELITGYGTNAIERAKEEYRKAIIQRKEQGDEDFATRISEAEFIDMYIGNLRSMKREMMMILAFLGLVAWAAGDDDDKKTPGQKLLIKALDKYYNELAFFYNPKEARSLIKSPAPIVGLFEDMYNFFTHSFGQGMGFAMSDKEAMKENYPSKYFFKMFPISKVGMDWWGTLDDDFRKDMGLR